MRKERLSYRNPGRVDPQHKLSLDLIVIHPKVYNLDFTLNVNPKLFNDIWEAQR